MPLIHHSRGRRPKRYSQADRLARMMRTLASRAVTVNDLADEFGITRRQVYRDLAQIEEEGHPLEQSDDGGEKSWQLPLGYKGLPPITLSPYELMSLQLGRAQLAYLNGTPFVEDLDQTLEKLRSSLPSKTINHLDRIMQVFAPITTPLRSYAEKSSILRDLRKALLLQLTMVLDYKKPGMTKPFRYQVNPFALVLYQHGLYLIGFSHRAKQERLFAVDRMKSITVTEERFELPKNFSATERFSTLFGLIDEPPQDIRIQFSSDVAHLMQERQCHPTQRIKKLKNGSVEVSFRAGGLDEIAWWVPSWGKEAKALSPPKLVKIMTDQLSKSLKRYSRA